MSTKIKKKDNKEKRGFTLIELLAVIVVLGVVASITIVVFTGTKDSSKKQISEVNNKNILSSARDYAIEYLRDDSIWVPKTPTSDLYCVTVKNLIDKGFLRDTNKNLKDDMVIVVTKEKGSNNITTEFKQDDKDCNGMLPSVDINVSGKKKEGSDSYYDRVDFTVNLQDKDSLDIEIDTFRWVVRDASGKEISNSGNSCDVNGNSCSGSVEGKYGDITIEATVGNDGRTNTESKVVNIVRFEPEIVLTATGTKGNGEWYISDVGVEAKVVNGDSSLYNAPAMCISSNGSECSNTSGSSKVTLREVNSGKMVCASVRTKAGYVGQKCSSYLIDTSVPSVDISGGYNVGSGKVDVYGAISDGGSGVDSYSVKGYGGSVDYCKDSYKGSFSSTDGSRGLLKSYAANGDGAVWVKDKAGNCGKVGYAVGVNKNATRASNTGTTLYVNAYSPYKMKSLVYAGGIIDNGNVRVTKLNSNHLSGSNKSGLRFGYSNMDIVDTKMEWTTKTVNARRTQHTDTECTRYACNYGGSLNSRNRCTGSDYSIYTKYNNVTFYCTCKQGNCEWSYKSLRESQMDRYGIDRYGNCLEDGYSRNRSRDYGGDTWYSYTSGEIKCSVSQANSNATKSISDTFYGWCEWDGDYKAECTREKTTYYCYDDEYKSGNYCYYCSDSSYELNRTSCSKDVKTTVNYFDYGRYAYVFVIDD